ncbi:30S ribosomal protein S13 [Candidatus Pacearchaeota archaeon ex4484_71]|nr:MAG: 30S ribosomal protein S13 [Candidatus Pacearchaeota archaeon ex4484_71]
MSKENKKKQVQEKHEDRVIRILSTDVEGKMSVYAGLSKVKGISWSFANAICSSLNLDKKKKIGLLSEAEIKKIEELVKEKKIPTFLQNRRNDFESGEDRHLLGSDLELRTEFDIKRLKKIKSYRGLRHSSNLPSRGQRTKSNFRRNRRKGAGIKKKNKK